MTARRFSPPENGNTTGMSPPGPESTEHVCDVCATYGRTRVAYYPTARGWACWEHFAPNAENDRDRIARTTDRRHSHGEIARRLGARRPRDDGR